MVVSIGEFARQPVNNAYLMLSQVLFQLANLPDSLSTLLSPMSLYSRVSIGEFARQPVNLCSKVGYDVQGVSIGEFARQPVNLIQ